MPVIVWLVTSIRYSCDEVTTKRSPFETGASEPEEVNPVSWYDFRKAPVHAS